MTDNLKINLTKSNRTGLKFTVHSMAVRFCFHGNIIIWQTRVYTVIGNKQFVALTHSKTN